MLVFLYLCDMDSLKIFNVDSEDLMGSSLADVKVHSGFASSHNGMQNAINLNRELSTHPESTFYARVEGEAMRDAGVGDGDILVVDKSLDLQNGDMAVCIVNGEFVVRLVERYPDHVLLVSANPDYAPVTIGEGDAFEVWGVVTYTIRKMRGWGRKSKK